MTIWFRRLFSAALATGVAILATPFFFFEAAPSPSPSNSDWLLGQIGRGIGPPGGEIRTLVAAHGDPERLYAGTASGHIFVTDDGAKVWRDCRARLPRRAVLSRLAVDPRSPDTAYAAYYLPEGGGGVLRSTDGGANWDSLALPGAPAVRALAISPSEPCTLWAGGPAGVWRSADGGETWMDAGGVTRLVREVESLAVDPRLPQLVYAGTWRQAYRSLDGGGTWMPIGQGMDLDRDVFTIALSPHDPEKVMAGTCGFLYTSDDGGDQWSVQKQGFLYDHRRIHAIAMDPVRPLDVWAGTRGGIYHSTDGASSFGLVQGGVSVSAIITDPKGERVYAGTEELGILAKRGEAAFAESNEGLDAARVAAFDAFPGGLGSIVAARSDGPGVHSLWASPDSGRTWTPFAPGKRFRSVRFARALSKQSLRVLVIAEDGSWRQVSSSGRVENVVPPPGRLSAVKVAPDAGVVLAATAAGLFLAPAGDLPTGRARPAGGKKGGAKAPAGGQGSWRRVHAGKITALALEGDRFLALGPGRVVRGRVSALAAKKQPERVQPSGLPAGVVAAALGPEAGSSACAITRSLVLKSDDLGATWREVELPWPANGLCALEADANPAGRVAALDSHGALLVGGWDGRPWAVLPYDPWLEPSQDLRLGRDLPGIALVATLGHGVRVISLEEAK